MGGTSGLYYRGVRITRVEFIYYIRTEYTDLNGFPL